MSVRAVVVNYKTWRDLDRFVKTWVEHAPTSPWTLRIVNVCPESLDTDIARKWVSEIGDDRAFYEFHDDNVGYGRACNDAVVVPTIIEDEAPDVYAFFNADVWFKTNGVQEVLDAMAENPEWGIVGPRQTNRKGEFTHAGIFGTGDKPQHRKWFGQDRGQCSDIRDDAVTVSGAAYFIRTGLWRELTKCRIFRDGSAELGLPSPCGAFLTTQHYYEETWCSYHARAHSAKIVYYGPASIIHEYHQASPPGGHADLMMPASKEKFQAMCDMHGIVRD